MNINYWKDYWCNKLMVLTLVSFVKFALNNLLHLIKRLHKIGIFFFFLSWLISGCAVKKHLKEDQYLINKYRINIENKHSAISNSELRSFFRPKPNSKFLGVRWKLSTYYKLQKKRSKFNNWRYENFGEDPNFYEEDFADRIAYKMERYLDNIGFFNSKVTYESPGYSLYFQL